MMSLTAEAPDFHHLDKNCVKHDVELPVMKQTKQAQELVASHVTQIRNPYGLSKKQGLNEWALLDLIMESD